MENDSNNLFSNPITPQPASPPQPEAPAQPEQAPQAAKSNLQPVISQPASETPVAQASNQSVPTPTTPAPKKSNRLVSIIIIATIAIAFIVAAIFVLPKLFGGNSDDDSSVAESLSKSKSFFILNEDTKLAAIFDVEGNQITDFIFTDYDDFYNGAAMVKNKDEQYGIIGTDGKMIVDFGVYRHIIQYDALFSCSDEEYDDYLVDARGKVLLKADSLDVDSADYDGPVTIVKQKGEDDDGTYSIYNYNGTVMATFPAVKDEDDNDLLAINEHNYTSVYYQGTTYIFDSAKSKQLLSVEDETPFCIADVNKRSTEEFAISTCKKFGDLSETAKNEQKLIRDGKIVFTKPNEEGRYQLTFMNGAIVYDGNLLDAEGNKVAKTSDILFKDSKNYILKGKSGSDKATLYVDGKEQQQVSCRYISNGYIESDIYALDYCDGYDKGSNIFMKYDGTIINKTAYEDISDFDENGYASVSEDGKDYYLINADGDSVSAKYSGGHSAHDNIYKVDGVKDVYRGKNSDGTISIFKIGGDTIATGDKITYTSQSSDTDDVCITLLKNDKYEIYNVTAGKLLVTLDTSPEYDSQYFRTFNNSKTQYYSRVNGKMFYEN